MVSSIPAKHTYIETNGLCLGGKHIDKCMGEGSLIGHALPNYVITHELFKRILVNKSKTRLIVT